MIQRIPAKTFILGEYAVLQGYPGLILNTSPSFELTLTSTPTLEGIHPDSPAGQFWRQEGLPEHGLKFYDPYRGLGGLGASSAQFLAAYLCAFGQERDPKTVDLPHLLTTYERYTWNGVGPKPSGYDVLGQLSSSCTFVSKQPLEVRMLNWAFSGMSVVLIHTGVKCVTHTHLHQLDLSLDLSDLGSLVIEAKEAIERQRLEQFCACLNAYEARLRDYGWVVDHTRSLVDTIKNYPGIRAVKGCGALGSDVVLILVETPSLSSCVKSLKALGLNVLYTT